MSTIPNMLRARVLETPDKRAYSSYRDGRWHDTSWRGLEEQAAAFGLGLNECGLARGQTVAILGGTRPEWVLSDLGALGAGAVTVGLYPTLQPEGIGSMHYVLEHSEASVLVVENAATYTAKIAPVIDRLPALRHIVYWDGMGQGPHGTATAHSWSDVLASGRALLERDPEAWTRSCAAARPDELALLIYTSGTTGQPKGAMLTHGNIVSLHDALFDMFPPDIDGDHGSTVSFLPMAHAAERCVGHYGRIRQGYATHFARSIETLLEDLVSARPTRFGSVPRIFEKVYARVQGELGKTKGVKGFLARAVYKAGIDAGRARRRGERVAPLLRILDRVFQHRIATPLRARFGGRCGWFISGAAPISVDILELFDACGMATYEAYGLTETSGVLTWNRPGALRYGTVGRAIPCVELRIASDGEVIARGANVFSGYYKDPDATAEALKDGWFHSGDIGVLDQDGYLRITDRKKNILVTAGGKNITPANIENAVKNHPLVSFCHLHADRRAHATALICLDPDQLKAFATERGLTGARLHEAPAVQAEIEAAIARVNATFAPYERIKRFTILAREFSIDGGELTPTLKIKRKVVDEKYARELDAMYPS